VFRAGNRAGKTTAGAIELGWWLTGQHPYLKVPTACRTLCVANDWSMIGSPIWEKLSVAGGVKLSSKGRASPPILPARMLHEISWHERARNIPNFVKLPNGATLTFRSCESGRERFQGTEFDLVWIDEELVDEGVYAEIQRALIDRGGKLIWTATPLARARPMIGLHEMASKADSKLSVEEFVASMLDNPHIDEAAKLAFVEQIMQEHPEQYETRVRGGFLVMEGLVYPTFRSNIHLISRDAFNKMDVERRNPRIVGIDPGFADPFALLWAMIREDGGLVFYREFYKTKVSLRDVMGEAARQSVYEPIVGMHIDPSSHRHDSRGNLTVYEEVRQELMKAGMHSALTGGAVPLHLANNLIDAGLYKVQEMMAPLPNGVPGILVVDDLQMFLREIRRYMWAPESAIKNISKKPIDKDNHLMDCMRYICMGKPAWQAVTPPGPAPSGAYASWLRYKEKKDKALSNDSITIGG
jgi:phage terminase large subunit-like protein